MSTQASGTLRSLIVAVSENGVIGREGRLPWHLSDDLRRFKRLTMGHHLIMGRRTYESIGRTRRKDWSPPDLIVAADLAQAYAAAAGDEELFVVGGGEIYRQALASVQRLYITLVHARIDGDTRFPEMDWNDWQLLEETACAADERNSYPATFRIYQRRTTATTAAAP
jgi:dihydrofolate reductase